MPHFLTSAKDGRNLDDGFSILLTNIINNESLQKKIVRNKETFKIADKQSEFSKRSKSKKNLCT